MPSSKPANNETIKKARKEFIFPQVISNTNIRIQRRTIRITMVEVMNEPLK
jgi:hypothetical protein